MSNPYGQSPAPDEPQPSGSSPAGPPEYQQPGYAPPPAAEDPYQQYAPVSYPPSGSVQPAYGQAPYGQQYGGPAPEHPQGTIILVLGILGFFTIVTAPFAWYLGSKTTKEIKASGVAYSNESFITIGRILGIVITLLTLLFIVLGGIALLVFVGLAANS